MAAHVQRILRILDDLYPWDGRCFLDHQTPWQLLFATILSAQCTDERVNQVTRELFARFPTLESYAQADLHDLEAVVHSTGFFRAKARHLQQTARLLLEKHGGQVPPDMDALTALPGVGRKTANVVRGHAFGLPGVTVDTHVGRVTRRLGLAPHTCPVKMEFALMDILPPSHWLRYNQQIITHGRSVCSARSPRCGTCGLASVCAKQGVEEKCDK